jgi:hypothetical protein
MGRAKFSGYPERASCSRGHFLPEFLRPLFSCLLYAYRVVSERSLFDIHLTLPLNFSVVVAMIGSCANVSLLAKEDMILSLCALSLEPDGIADLALRLTPIIMDAILSHLFLDL